MPIGDKKGGQSSYAGQYTIETADFWCNDNRVQGLNGKCRILLFYLGLFAMIERREILPSHYNLATICRRVAIDLRGADKLVKQIAAKCLIEILPDGRIRVCGARDRRPHFKWKDETQDGLKGQSNFDQAVSSKLLREEKPQGVKPKEPKEPEASGYGPPPSMTKRLFGPQPQRSPELPA